jgi:hypothetical protein
VEQLRREKQQSVNFSVLCFRFRKFLQSSKLTQLDFLLRVEQLRREKQQEAGQEVDEEGNLTNSGR